MSALGLLWAAVSPVQAQAPNDDSPPPSPWTRDTLGGDWGGMRSALGQQGMRLDFWATGFYQDMFKGTGNDDGGFGGRADLLFNGDTGKLGLWEGGGLHAHVTYRGGDLPAFRGGTPFPVHTSGLLPVGGDDEVVATSLYVSQQGIEACYAFVPAPWLRLTANLQWVNPAYGANPSVWLGGVRMRVEF